jgi:hypothetical protein
MRDTIEPLLHRIRGEFAEMPGLKLTREQAARLWHLDPETTTEVLRNLEEMRFLYRTQAGAYRRTESS